MSAVRQSVVLGATLALLPSGGCKEEGSASTSPPASASASVSAAVSASAAVVACDEPCLSIERCEAGKCVPSCPEGQVYVPATGEKGFTMGQGKAHEPDRAHTVVLTKPFCMDSTEVTVAAYRKCQDAGKCTEPELRDINANSRPWYKRDKHPVNQVHYRQAKAYCEHIGGSLPTEAQWEWAASHGDGRKYPWGNDEPTCETGHADFTPNGSPQSDPAGDVGCHGGGTSEVGTHEKGASVWPDGEIHDLGGNVWEWNLDCFVPYPKEKVVDPLPTKNPALGDDCFVFSLRGGGWNRSKFGLRPRVRAGSKWKYQVPGLGFRCVTNPE